jgi:L-arabinose isomerase
MLPSSTTVEGGGSVTRGLPELEAWFATGSQRLYGDDRLRQVDRPAGRIAACLDETPATPFKRALRWNHVHYSLGRGV